MPIHKTRDNSFKLIFGNHELFVEFLRDFIPIDILKDVKPEAIEDISERFLPLFQEGRDSDTVKRISLKDGGAPLFVIAVVEHESKVNYRAGFKMLQYICLILDQYEKEVNREHPGIIQTKDFSYPPVLPVIFYDGPETWTAPLNFADRTEMCGIFAKYVPGFEYLLVELNRYSQEDRVHQFFPCAFFASQKTGLSASIFWLCQKDLRCNPWRGPG
ncbi:MAG: Rpn family recombination-promoting nuclease/putative transposase, partial [Spirochaetales bacterium]|nr:Rpn family recombination-promoting nuclease/putative transposase [Spirochaetales bacterium]